jgi:uridine phosphorylase
VAAISAQTMTASGGRQYHLGAAPGDVARNVLLVGDPARAERAAMRFDRLGFESAHREYRIFTGELAGLPISIVSVGIGAGAMEVALIELCQLVAQPNLIRAGTCGALRSELTLGDLVISQAALRMENTSLGYVDVGFPAFAHAEAQLALLQAAEELGAPHHVGITATAAGFYGAQGRDVPGFVPKEPGLLVRLAQQSILSLEMETSCLLTLAALRGLRAGSVCSVFASRTSDVRIDAAEMDAAQDVLISVGLGALRNLARMEKERGGRPHWHPGCAMPNATK